MDDEITSEQDRLLNKLLYVGEAQFNSHENENRQPCLQNTRVKILEEIRDWARSTSRQCIYLLQGMAGTGKSTIALTVAHQLQELALHVASFFFKRGAGELARTRKLIPTVVHQMAYQSPSFREYVTAVIMKNPSLGRTASCSAQYEKLLIQPLRDLRSAERKLHPVIILIDALDECDDEREIRTLLQLLATTEDLSLLGLRIFVTSRPEIPVRLGFREMPDILFRSLALQDVPRSIVDGDIEMFVKDQLMNLRHERDLSIDWPQATEVQKLASKAAGLFIFASTACNYIGGSNQADPRKRLEQVCSTVTSNQLMTEELDQMYTIVVNGSVTGKLTEEEDQHFRRQFRRVVGSIILLYNPLSVLELHKLLLDSDIESPSTINHILNPLQAVLNISSTDHQPIQLLHLSFRDFLLDNRRCKDPRFCVDESQIHNDLATSCLRLISSSVPQNFTQNFAEQKRAISDLKNALSPAVKYACRYWVKHVQNAQITLYDNGFVHEFLKKDLLSWVQSMSLIKDYSGAIEGIKDLITSINVRLSVTYAKYYANGDVVTNISSIV